MVFGPHCQLLLGAAQFFLFKSDYKSFLEAIAEGIRKASPEERAVFQHFAGDGLLCFLEDEEDSREVCKTFLEFIRAGNVAVMPELMSIRTVKEHPDGAGAGNAEIDELREAFLVLGNAPLAGSADPRKTKYRRCYRSVAQVATIADGNPNLKKSIFSSIAERMLWSALQKCFPGLMICMHVGLNRIVESEHPRHNWAVSALDHINTESFDAVILNPISGEPMAALELDDIDDDEETRRTRRLTDEICSTIGLDLIRLRLNDSENMDANDWYLLLVDEVEGRFSYGPPIRQVRGL